jgi:hypothetical protein
MKKASIARWIAQAVPKLPTSVALTTIASTDLPQRAFMHAHGHF